MRTANRLGVLIVSILLWIVFFIPRLVVGIIKIVKIILSIVEQLILHFIKLVQDETIKKM